MIETNPDKITDATILRSEFTLRFHFKFWEPVNCVGGKVYFGTYYEHVYVLRNGQRSTTSLQTPAQVRNKSGVCW